MSELLEVTQADIDAARALVGVPADPDYHATDHAVQAFAAHRLAGRTSALEEARKLADQRASAHRYSFSRAVEAKNDEHQTRFAVAAREAEEIATAIAALTPSVDGGDERAEIERQCAELIANYYRAEIGRLMHQAEHWAENGAPLATHHRVNKADSYFQIVCLMERDTAKGWKPPFDEIRDQLAKPPIKRAGAYPPSPALHRYRDACFVAALVTNRADRCAKLETDLAASQSEVELWKREAADRSEGMVQLNLDRAAMGVAIEQLREALVQADLKIRSYPGADQSDVEFIRIVLQETSMSIEPGQIARLRNPLAPVNRDALERSIAQLEEFERAGKILDEIENWTEFGESVMLCLHELKRLRHRLGVVTAPANSDNGSVPECTNSPNGRHQVDTSMESGSNNCFFCGEAMGRVR